MLAERNASSFARTALAKGVEGLRGAQGAAVDSFLQGPGVEQPYRHLGRLSRSSSSDPDPSTHCRPHGRNRISLQAFIRRSGDREIPAVDEEIIILESGAKMRVCTNCRNVPERSSRFIEPASLSDPCWITRSTKVAAAITTTDIDEISGRCSMGDYGADLPENCRRKHVVFASRRSRKSARSCANHAQRRCPGKQPEADRTTED